MSSKFSVSASDKNEMQITAIERRTYYEIERVRNCY